MVLEESPEENRDSHRPCKPRFRGFCLLSVISMQGNGSFDGVSAMSPAGAKI